MIKVVIKEPVPDARHVVGDGIIEFARTMHTFIFTGDMNEVFSRITDVEKPFRDYTFLFVDAVGRKFAIPGDNIAWIEEFDENRQSVKVS